MFSQLLKSKATIAGKYVYILIQEGDSHLNRKTLTCAEKYSPGQEIIHPERKILTWAEDTWADIYSLGQEDTHLGKTYSFGQKSFIWRGRCSLGQEDTWPDIYSLGQEVPIWAGMILTWAGRCRTR